VPMPDVLHELLSLPTAPFVEDAVLAAIERRVRSLRHVTLRRDAAGNLIARYRRTPKAPPIAFSAHTDHPGFVARRMRPRRRLEADFRGGVYEEYFTTAGVRFWTAGRSVRGRVERVLAAREIVRDGGRRRVPTRVRLRVEADVEPGAPGMWDLPEPSLRADRVRARGCDDVAGCAALVMLLERLARRAVRADVTCLFTRAEEVGFVGAIAAARGRTLPLRTPIVAIETSSARAGARIGAGPVLRVGDRASSFDPLLTDFCGRVAQKLGRRPGFRFQRKLMDGGTCETTALAAYGYRSTGICLALGNYHNMDVRRRRIAREVISLGDFEQMVDWFEAIARDPTGPGDELARRREMMEALYRKWQKLL